MLLLDGVVAAQGGCKNAYQNLIEQTQQLVTIIALGIVKDVATSEDIAQQVYLKCWTNLSDLRNPNAFLGWLRQSTRNIALNHIRQHSREVPLEQDNAEMVLSQCSEYTPGLEEQLQQQQQQQAVTQIIEALPAEIREVVLLYYREGESSEQVAKLLELSPSTVRKQLSRARQTIKKSMLARYGQVIISTAPTAGFAMMMMGILSTAPTAAATSMGTVAAGGSKKLAVAIISSAFWVPIMTSLLVYAGSGAAAKILQTKVAKKRYGQYRVALSVWILLSGSIFVTSYDWGQGAFWPITVYTLFAAGLTFGVNKMQAFLWSNASPERRADETDKCIGKVSRTIAKYATWAGLISGYGGLLTGLYSSGRLGF